MPLPTDPTEALTKQMEAGFRRCENQIERIHDQLERRRAFRVELGTTLLTTLMVALAGVVVGLALAPGP